MHPSLFTAAGLFCLVGITTVAPAQALPRQPGTRIRMTVPCGITPSPAPEGRRTACTIKGELIGWRTDTIELAMDGARISYSLNAVSQFEVGRGYRSHWLLGTGIGFVVGAGSTFLLLHGDGSTSPCNPSANQDALRSSECLGWVGLGGLAGAGLGSLIGGQIRTERWQKVARENLRINVVSSKQFMLGLIVEF